MGNPFCSRSGRNYHSPFGMSNIAQMEDNISYMKDFTKLSDDEKKTLDEAARTTLNSIPLIPCTTCNYCAKVCPNEIGISGTFTGYELSHIAVIRQRNATSGVLAGLAVMERRVPLSASSVVNASRFARSIYRFAMSW